MSQEKNKYHPGVCVAVLPCPALPFYAIMAIGLPESHVHSDHSALLFKLDHV